MDKKTVEEYEEATIRLSKMIAEQTAEGGWKNDMSKMCIINGLIFARCFFDMETPVFLNRNGRDT